MDAHRCQQAHATAVCITPPVPMGGHICGARALLWLALCHERGLSADNEQAAHNKFPCRFWHIRTCIIECALAHAMFGHFFMAVYTTKA